MRIGARVFIELADSPVWVLDVADRVHAVGATCPIVNVNLAAFEATSDVARVLFEASSVEISARIFASSEVGEEHERPCVAERHAGQSSEKQGTRRGIMARPGTARPPVPRRRKASHPRRR